MGPIAAHAKRPPHPQPLVPVALMPVTLIPVTLIPEPPSSRPFSASSGQHLLGSTFPWGHRFLGVSTSWHAMKFGVPGIPGPRKGRGTLGQSAKARS